MAPGYSACVASDESGRLVPGLRLNCSQLICTLEGGDVTHLRMKGGFASLEKSSRAKKPGRGLHPLKQPSGKSLRELEGFTGETQSSYLRTPPDIELTA